MKSSLTFQVLTHLGSYYFGIYALMEFLLLVYKFIGKLSFDIHHFYKRKIFLLFDKQNISVLPFPVGTLVAEIILLLFLIFVESIRLFAGWKSNLTENAGGMSISVMLFIPGILGVLYFLIWQVCT